MGALEALLLVPLLRVPHTLAPRTLALRRLVPHKLALHKLVQMTKNVLLSVCATVLLFSSNSLLFKQENYKPLQ